MEVRTQAVGLYVPVDTATFEFRGESVTWRRDVTVIEEGHAILRGRMHMVRPLTIDYPARAKPVKAAA